VTDLLDLEADRRHPRKRHRPLASGALPIHTALLVAPALFAVGGGLALWAGVLPYVLLYVLASLAYAAKLKTMPLIDAFVLAGLYSVRLYAGGVATAHPESLWLLAFSGFLFLGLALMKRVVELRDLEQRGETQIGRLGYRSADLTILAGFGTAATFISSLVLALYVQSDAALALTYNRYALWAIVPLMLFWQCRLWLAVSRGYITDDPVVYTAHDWVSAFVATGLLAALIVARTPF
jgi:4-hydroxybenzoate polyprenyltransferase